MQQTAGNRQFALEEERQTGNRLKQVTFQFRGQGGNTLAIGGCHLLVVVMIGIELLATDMEA